MVSVHFSEPVVWATGTGSQQSTIRAAIGSSTFSYCTFFTTFKDRAGRTEDKNAATLRAYPRSCRGFTASPPIIPIPTMAAFLTQPLILSMRLLLVLHSRKAFSTERRHQCSGYEIPSSELKSSVSEKHTSDV